MNNPFIIAEIGINHNGDMKVVHDLIKVAHAAGCDAVKFQKRNISIVYPLEFLEEYRESQWGTTQKDQKEGLEFDTADYKEIDRFCHHLGIQWFASAWDEQSQLFLRNFNMLYNKLASAMMTHLDFVEMVAKERKHTFISTGMCTQADVDDVVQLFETHKTPYTLLHCISIYPCPNELCHLDSIEVIDEKYKKNKFYQGIGYSDHSKGHIASVVAVSLGACVIEKHITLDRTMYGSDQAASIEPEQLGRLCRDCRNVGIMMDGKDNEDKIINLEKEVAKKLRYWEGS